MTRLLPADEKFGLTSQLRAAVSIPANIAEGSGRTRRGDYLHHLSFAEKGELMEVETLLTISARLKLLSHANKLSNHWVYSSKWAGC